MKFSKSQIASFLKLGDEYKKTDGTPFTGLFEKTLTDSEGRIAETLALTVEYGELIKGDRVGINGEEHKVAYIDDDLSGLVTCYLEVTGGGRGKYK